MFTHFFVVLKRGCIQVEDWGGKKVAGERQDFCPCHGNKAGHILKDRRRGGPYPRRGVGHVTPERREKIPLLWLPRLKTAGRLTPRPPHDPRIHGLRLPTRPPRVMNRPEHLPKVRSSPGLLYNEEKGDDTIPRGLQEDTLTAGHHKRDLWRAKEPGSGPPQDSI